MKKLIFTASFAFLAIAIALISAPSYAAAGYGGCPTYTAYFSNGYSVSPCVASYYPTPSYQYPVYQQPVYQYPVYQTPVYQTPSYSYNFPTYSNNYYYPANQLYYYPSNYSYGRNRHY